MYDIYTFLFVYTVMSPEIRPKKGAKSGGRVAESVREWSRGRVESVTFSTPMCLNKNYNFVYGAYIFNLRPETISLNIFLLKYL